MKILIWFGCISVSAIIQTFLEIGIGISSPLLQFLVTCAVARHFCKKLDERCLIKEKEKSEETSEFKPQSEPIFKESLVADASQDSKEIQEQAQNPTISVAELDLEPDDVPSVVARRFDKQMEDVRSCNEKEFVEDNSESSHRKTEHALKEYPEGYQENNSSSSVVLSKETSDEETKNVQEAKSVKGNSHVVSAADSSSPFEILKKLKELNDVGIITDDEYKEKKKEILGRI